mgnify:CR=1 FL=1
MNPSGLEPAGVAVLLEPHEPEKKAGKIIIPENVKERTTMLESRARVIAIGKSAWHDEPHPRAEVGDLVVVTSYAGAMVKGPADGKIYRVVNDRDIYCRITHEGTPVKLAEVVNG